LLARALDAAGAVDVAADHVAAEGIAKRSAGSRCTRLPGPRLPSVVQARVSGPTSAWNVDGRPARRATMVRHAPLTAMLAPMGSLPTSRLVFTVSRRVPPALARKDSTLPNAFNDAGKHGVRPVLFAAVATDDGAVPG
jgi:hypothetical protein